MFQVLDPAADVCFELVDGVVVAALQQVLGDEGEEPFHLVEPTGIRWGEVHLESRVPTVGCETPSRAATSVFANPSEQANSIRDRNAKACEDFRRRAHLVS